MMDRNKTYFQWKLKICLDVRPLSKMFIRTFLKLNISFHELQFMFRRLEFFRPNLA